MSSTDEPTEPVVDPYAYARTHRQHTLQDRMEPPIDFSPSAINKASVAEQSTNILDRANILTSITRRREYGHPYDNFKAGAAIMQQLIKRRYNVDLPLTADFYGLLMLAVKIDREAGKHSLDNLEDIAGYARCIQLAKEIEVELSQMESI